MIVRMKGCLFSAFCWGVLSASSMGANDKLHAIIEVAIEALNKAQKQSIEQGVELCGFIIEKEGRIFATPKVIGDDESCQASYPRAQFTTLASYHTHGNHDRDYLSEVPSVSDFTADDEDKIYGFVGTPGGRVWLIDPFHKLLIELCERCIMSDGHYDENDFGEIPNRFTPESLHRYLNEQGYEN